MRNSISRQEAFDKDALVDCLSLMLSKGIVPYQGLRSIEVRSIGVAWSEGPRLSLTITYDNRQILLWDFTPYNIFYVKVGAVFKVLTLGDLEDVITYEDAKSIVIERLS